MKKTSLFNIKNTSAGFTLVELLVSLALFTIAMTVSIGSLYTVSQASKRVQAMRSVLDNLNFAMESMSRNIRTGTKVTCGPLVNINAPVSCALSTGGSDTISFQSTLGVQEKVSYTLDQSNPNAISIAKVVAPLDTDTSGTIVPSTIAVTAPEIQITSLKFFVDGNDAGGVSDLRQPNVIIIVSGVATVNDQSAPFTIQTYASQRTIE